jgi:hypothetical protein
MYNLSRRLGKIEKQLGVGKKDTVILDWLGKTESGETLEMDSDEFRKLLDEIDGSSKGKLPCEEEIPEGMALRAGDTET